MRISDWSSDVCSSDLVGSVHGDAPLGYELSGNAALFRGDYKLVRNLAPTGDGAWRLFDLKADPGETRTLAAAEPDRFKTMLADYRAYATANGVLHIPGGDRKSVRAGKDVVIRLS